MVWYNVTGVAEIPYTMAMELRAAQVGSRKIDNMLESVEKWGHFFGTPCSECCHHFKPYSGFRSLTQYESDMLTHARICLVCHNADQQSLKNCGTCHCVAYCSDTCRAEDKAEKISTENFVGLKYPRILKAKMTFLSKVS